MTPPQTSRSERRWRWWGGKRWERGRWVAWFDWSLDMLPIPRAGICRAGEYAEVYAKIGPDGCDPILGFTIKVPRP